MKNKLPQRKRTRYKDFDYSSDGYYFITICVENRNNFFGIIYNGKINLNAYGNILEKCWLDLPNHYNCTIDYYSIMPDHFHGIIIIERSTNSNNKNYSLSEIIRGFKTFSSRKINLELQNKDKFKWQKSFYDRIIRNEKELYQIRKYIEQNPLKWEFDKGITENLFI